MMYWSLLPMWLVDLLGSLGMIIFSALCLYLAGDMLRRDPEHPLANYLFWLCGALFAFSLSRSLGHIIVHLLYFADLEHWSARLKPISGSINTITFVIIASVTLFFHRMQTIMSRMTRDRGKIEQISGDLLQLNRDMATIISERTRTEMALRLAHEVRNPAMIIGGLLKRVGKARGGRPANQEYLDKVVMEAKKLEELVKKLEEMQPKRQLFFSTQDLSQLVEEAIAVVQAEADKKEISFLLDRAPAALVFQGNAELLKIALFHILRNAIEACGAGDIIQVTTNVGSDGLEVKVADNGPGIPLEIMEHIFEPFLLTEKGKTGLSLAFVKQIVEEHRGKIEIASEEGKGTEVTIALPTHLGELAGKRGAGRYPAG